MFFMQKAIGFMAVMTVISGGYAVTSARPSVMKSASSRMPSLTTSVTRGSTITVTPSMPTTTDTECIDDYLSCLNDGDVCGSSFEECTTRVLFHAQMPKCLNVLNQCSANAINRLYGTSATTSLGAIASKNEHGEVVDYTFPSDWQRANTLSQ